MTSLLLFGSSFLIVFLLGFQSQLVKDKHALFAFFVSLGIGICQVASFKIVPNATFWESAFFILGGAFGISSSIFAYDFWLKRYKNRQKIEDKQQIVKEFKPNHPAYIASIDN